MGESKYIFEAKTIQRMELLVLNTLKWRMQAITPFSFIDYFLQKINDDEASIGASILQSSELILSTVRGTCLYSILTLCSNNKYMLGKEVEMIIWGMGIQCRNWLHRVQTLRDCSSSGNICGGGRPNSSNRESKFWSDSACRKGIDMYMYI